MISALDAFLPVPPSAEPSEWWGRLPIREDHEPLVPVTGMRIDARSLYAEMGIPGASPNVLLRAGVVRQLQNAAALLPFGWVLTVFDGFRPLSVQRHLYDSFTAEIRAKNPGIGDEDLRQQAGAFVATPNSSHDAPPPHRTGGAVDVYLVDSHGVPVPMGTAADEISPMSVTDWFERHPLNPFTTNRRILHGAMTQAGFVNYSGEWWHYDFGNQRWANITGAANAIYGVPQEDMSLDSA